MITTAILDVSEVEASKVAVERLVERLLHSLHKTVTRDLNSTRFEEIFSSDIRQVDWIAAGASTLRLLVEAGIYAIASHDLMPRRSTVSLASVGGLVLQALAAGGAVQRDAALRAARASGMAFFMWALSGISYLPSIGLCVVGLHATAAAHMVRRLEGSVKGDAQRQRRISRTVSGTAFARGDAAAAILQMIYDAILVARHT